MLMISEFLVPICVLIGITVWMTLKHMLAAHQDHRQSDIARRGSSCKGRVVAIQRPFMLDACTRLYFDFEPPGAARPLRACHVDRRPPDEARASLPATGSIVTVHYLPDRPRQAVISRLV